MRINSFPIPHSPNPTDTHFQTVLVVSPDRISNSLLHQNLLSVQLESVEYLTPSSLLKALPLPHPSCLLIDFQLPEMNGLQLMETLRRHNQFHPCIFTAPRIEQDLLVTLMNSGAFAFLKKPYKHHELIDTVQKAISFDSSISPYINEAVEYRSRRDQLSRREQEIISFLEQGKTAAEIASEINLSRRTVENHRVRILRKTQIPQISQLITKAAILNLLRAHGTII